jgi:NADP-dependent 3-hydroxy acid dehydrogenase YdfG
MNGSPLVFITGASSGLGQALALRFPWRRLSAGPGRAPERRGRTLGRGAGIDAGRFAVYTADVRDVAATVAAGKACIAAQGVPDVVIANAGISVGIDTADPADLEVMRATLETNVLGMASTFHPFVAAMQERRSGRLVGIASVAGIRGLPGHGAYCASKAAVIGYCESLRGEMRPSASRW